MLIMQLEVLRYKCDIKTFKKRDETHSNKVQDKVFCWLFFSSNFFKSHNNCVIINLFWFVTSDGLNCDNLFTMKIVLSVDVV